MGFRGVAVHGRFCHGLCGARHPRTAGRLDLYDYYEHPTALNPEDPRDPDYARPDGQLRDFYGWPVAVTFDSSDNLFVLDANRGKVLLYRGPLGTAHAPGSEITATGRTRLFPGEPNPFSPRTRIRFELSSRGPATLSIFDVVLPAGVYWSQLETPGYRTNRKLVVVK